MHREQAPIEVEERAGVQAAGGGKGGLGRTERVLSLIHISEPTRPY